MSNNNWFSSSSHNNSSQQQPFQQQPAFQQQPTNHATSSFGGSTSFGVSPNVMTTSSTPQQSSFGQSQPQQPFGSSSNSFASPAPASSFGAAPPGAASTSFGMSNPTNMSSSSSNPFGASQTSNNSNNNAPPVTFGTSANLMTPNTTMSNNNNRNNNSGFGASSSSHNMDHNPFGGSGRRGSLTQTPPPSTGGFQQPQQRAQRPSRRRSSHAGVAASSSSFGNSQPSPFGSQPPPSSDNAFSSSAAADYTNNSMMGQSSSAPGGGFQLSATAQPFVSASSASPFNAATSHQQQQESGTADEELRLKAKMAKKKQLRADIEEKKQRLLERKKQKEERKKEKERSGFTPPVSPTPPSMFRGAAAASMAPPTTSRRRNKEDGPDGSSKKQTLAERNAIRFGEQGGGSSQQQSAAAPSRSIYSETTDFNVATSSSNKNNNRNRAELTQAKSLVGTCPDMCPEDEMIRRRQESDVQLLELPRPGELHPSHWTLTNTLVKRFRRSAADYKLDVPEWVRPPDVLEDVCGYLEEWVMERDRQGGDPRFPGGQAPPPLDVYQFIWDRTRMIRKDLTLQNYVGTGGKCDARAVRCHERIARWHAMCEHQLSHIDDFVVAQSQQNIQELGQCMKTLNQFYDDSLGRAIIDVPDENGNETRRSSLEQYSHGCSRNCVQGRSPVDFDGKPLANDDGSVPSSQRLVGKHAAKMASHGTSEAEMRALYILLTMDNEGGLEVLKYASNLFAKKPAIFYSKSVQLALEIFKAKKDYNYAKFFALLRSKTTPYLFCCIMFKHVGLMRKQAIKVMARTFGGKRKDTGQGMFDTYPLSRLAQLLCFEDMEEAKAACVHFNITVLQKKVSSPSGGDVAEVIFWKSTDFREPTHPEKGHVIPLRPKKMMRTIERKLNGATRLAVCRGDVSGDVKAEMAAGMAMRSALAISKRNNLTVRDGDQKSPISNNRQPQPVRQNATMPATGTVQDQSKNEAAIAKQEAEAKKRRALEERRIHEEKMAMKKKLELEAQAKAKQKLIEQEKQRRAEAVRQEEERKKMEEKRRRAEAEQRRLEEAEEKKRIADEKAKQVREALEKERIRQLQEEKKKLEEARRKEIERQNEILRQKAEAERKAVQEWFDRAHLARKVLLWRRWRRALDRRIVSTEESYSSMRSLHVPFDRSLPNLSGTISTTPIAIQRQLNSLRQVIERSSQKQEKLRFAKHVLKQTGGDLQENISPLKHPAPGSKTTILCKVAILIAHDKGVESSNLASLVRHWIKRQVEPVSATTRHSNSEAVEVRTVILVDEAPTSQVDCDVALLVFPSPCLEQSRRSTLVALNDVLDSNVPRVALMLSENLTPGFVGELNQEVDEYCRGQNAVLPVVYNYAQSPVAYFDALDCALRKAAELYLTEGCFVISRMPATRLVGKIVADCMLTAEWSQMSEEMTTMYALKAIDAVVAELKLHSENEDNGWNSWPYREFVVEGEVSTYFTDSLGLPMNWAKSSLAIDSQPGVQALSSLLESKLLEASHTLLNGAGGLVKNQFSSAYSKGEYRLGLKIALDQWQANQNQNEGTVFLPKGFLPTLSKRTSERLKKVTLEQPEGLVMLRPYDSFTRTPLRQHEIGRALVRGKRGQSIGELSTTDSRHDSETSLTRSPAKRVPCVISQERKKRKLAPDSVDLRESTSYSRRLQQLANGGTVESFVGDTSLSRLLENVPMMK